MALADHLAEFNATLGLIQSLRDKINAPVAAIPPGERNLLYEAVFIRLYRAYENALEEIFVCYLLQEQTISNVEVRSFVRPSNREHAKNIITASQKFLDWASPNSVVDRCDTYLEKNPIRDAITASYDILTNARKIRNHVAHNSRESHAEFIKVVRNFYLTLPDPVPSAGELLAHRPTSGPARGRDVLTHFMEGISRTVTALVG